MKYPHKTTSLKYLLLGSALFLNGCVSLFPQSSAPSKYYQLKAMDRTSQIASQKALYIDEPNVALVLSGRSIVVEKQGPEGENYLSHIKGHQWSEPLPRMIQRYWMNALRSEKWPEVYIDYPPGKIDLSLRTDVIDFNVVDPDKVKISMFLTLYDNQTKTVLSSKMLTHQLTSSSTVSGFVDQFVKAMHAASQDLNNWLASEGALKNNP